MKSFFFALVKDANLNFLYRFKPLTLLYGVEDDDLRESKKLPSNVTAVKVKTPTAFGHHHT